MPTPVTEFDDLQPGDLYEDTFHHPCLCIAVAHGEATGISLVDGSHPRAAHIGVSDVRKLTLEEAWHWKRFGPRDVVLPPASRWWRPKRSNE